MHEVILPGAPLVRRFGKVPARRFRRQTDYVWVDVAQLVEPRIVIPAVVGSSPIVHPILSAMLGCQLSE